jgi:deoxyribose-phosphate aldolase
VIILYGGKVRAEGALDNLLTVNNETRIMTPELPKAAMDQLLSILRANLDGDEFRIDHPRRTLEEFFLDVIATAKRESVETSGVVSGGRIADYLTSDSSDKNAVLENLLAAPAAAAPEVKVAETAMALHCGADEIDIVMPVGKFLSGDYEGVCDEISELKDICGDKKLKVILETGVLMTAENIKKAALICMYSGADFIKTSTGKEAISATPDAALVMCEAIREYYKETGRKVGFKAAGGINTVKKALAYYTIVKEVLGNEWLNNEWFRIGASSLANPLLTEITGQEIKLF